MNCMDENPCQSPKSPQEVEQRPNASDADGPLNVPTPFSERAARISVYAAFAVYLLGFATTLSPLLWRLFLVIDLAAFGLGIIGIIGGVKRGATATIRRGTLGALLSGLPLALIACLALSS